MHIKGMTLSEYLSKKRGRAIELARLTGLAQSSISRLARGAQKPSFEAIRAINDATKGAVSPADWFGKPSKARAAA